MKHELKRLAAGQLRGWQTMAALLLMVALASAASSTALAVREIVLVNPLQVHDPDRLVVLRGAYPSVAGDLRDPMDFLDYAKWLRGFDRLAAYSDHEGGVNVEVGGQVIRTRGAEVTSSFFATMGVSLRSGRSFGETEQRPGHNRVVIVGDALRRRTYSASGDFVGSTIKLNGVPFTVIGVAPDGFQFPRRSELWIPVSLGGDRVFTGAAIAYTVFGRLSPGCSYGLVRANWKDLARTVGRHHPSSWIGRHKIDVLPMSDAVVGDTKASLRVLILALALVWLCGAANASVIVLTRSTARTGELAIRWSLGASPRQLLRHIVADGVLVALLGVACGLFAAWASLRSMVRYLPLEYGGAATPQIDGTTLLMIGGLSVITGIVAVLPGLRKTVCPVDLSSSRRTTVSSAAGERLLKCAIVVQVAISLVLVTGTVALTAHILALQKADVGFTPHDAVAISLSLRHDAGNEQRDGAGAFDRIVDQVGKVPGVVAVGATSALPLGDSDVIALLFEVLGQPAPPFEERFAIAVSVTPGYLRAAGLTLLAGRFFSSQDDARGKPVVVVNRTLAMRYGGETQAVGLRLKLAGQESAAEVIGVVADISQLGLDVKPTQQVLLPQAQSGVRLQALVVRSPADVGRIVASVRAIAREADPAAPVYGAVKLDELVGRAVQRPRLISAAFAVFAALTAMLAAVGIYASLIQYTTNRRREIAVRMAIGASAGTVRRMVIVKALQTAGAGVAVGLLLSVAFSRVGSTFVGHLHPLSVSTYAIAISLVLLICLAASAAPTWLATRVDPAALLRCE